MTLPLTPWQVVLGKFASALSLAALFLAGTLPVVFMLLSLGEPDLGRIAASYVGALCLASMLLAAGLFLSSLCSDQITAYLAAVLVAALFLATGHPRVVAVLDGMAPDAGIGRGLARYFASLPHYESFLRGRIELRALIHFLGWTAVFLTANASAVKRLRP
jgi:ABC-2 type transport system permease protein